MDHAAWRSMRDETVWGRDGLASLVATEWLDTTPRALEAAPGLWHADGGSAIGVVDGERVSLPVGDELRTGDLLLRAITRDGMTALRVWSPDGAAHRGISTIVRFPEDPDARVRGTFLTESSPETIDRVSVDGHHSPGTFPASVSFAWEGATVRLAVEDRDGELFAAFSDATSGAESHRFRHLRMPAPDADGAVEVDLNRATLPPCAFSDHYLCMLPPPGNRLTVGIRAGEARVE